MSETTTREAPDAPGADFEDIRLNVSPRHQEGQTARSVGLDTSMTAAEEAEEELKYGAEHVIRLFVPVSLCMAVVIFTVNTVSFYTEDDGQRLLYTPFESKTDDAGSQLLTSLGNAAVLLGFIICMTVLLIFLYKFRCYKVIHAWLAISSAMLLTLFTALYTMEVLKSRNMCVSTPLVLFLLVNFAVVGMMCIHWKGPLYLQQAFLIWVSAIMALTFIKYLPEWTAWAVLTLISVWDLVAVLAPKGPLRMLVQLAQERNEPIFPALIYTSGVLYMYLIADDTTDETVKSPAASGGDETPPILVANSSSVVHAPPITNSVSHSSTVVLSTEGAKSKRPQVRRVIPSGMQPSSSSTSADVETASLPAPPPSVPARSVASRTSVVEESPESGIKLGLGDFIFYSVLVGKASSTYDWNTTMTCYVAILVGLSVTLLLLAVFRKALPALPISIFAGLIFYFCTRQFVSPFTSALIVHQLTY